MGTKEITLSEGIEIAKKMTTRSASLKDWRVRSKKKRAMREIARRLIAGKGYIEASLAELRSRFGDLCHYEENAPGADEQRIWGVNYDFISGNLHFVSI